MKSTTYTDKARFAVQVGSQYEPAGVRCVESREMNSGLSERVGISVQKEIGVAPDVGVADLAGRGEGIAHADKGEGLVAGDRGVGVDLAHMDPVAFLPVEVHDRVHDTADPGDRLGRRRPQEGVSAAAAGLDVSARPAIEDVVATAAVQPVISIHSVQ